MKLKSTRRHHAKALALSMSLGLIITQTCLSAATPVSNSNFITGNDEPAGKHKTKTFISRSNSSVKIYPDAVKKDMHVIAKKNNGRSIDFFVFDLEGTLMQNYKMKAKDHIKITGLKKGSYVFRVFCGDEETASGNFEIR